MKIPMSWFSDYTDISGITPKEYNEAITMTGSKVETIETFEGEGDYIEGMKENLQKIYEALK